MGFQSRRLLCVYAGNTTSAKRSLRKGGSAVICVLLLSGVVPRAPFMPGYCQTATAAYAEASGMIGSNKTVDIDVVDADIYTVVNALQQQTGLNFLIKDEGRPFGHVTVSLSHASLATALKEIAESANATVEPDENGIYVIRAAGGDDTSTDPAAAQTTAGSAAQPAPPANMQWRKLPLIHSDPNEIMREAHWTDGQDYGYSQAVSSTVPPPVAVNPMTPSVTTLGGPVQQIQPSVPLGSGNYGAQQQAGRSTDPYQQMQQFGFPGGGFQGNPGFPGAGGFQGNPGFPGAGGFQGNPGFPGQAGGANPFQAPGGAGGAFGNAGLPAGVQHVFAIESDNSLYIEATPEGFNAVRDIVRALDVAPRQVEIKTEFITATVADVDAFGINFQLLPFPNVAINNQQGSGAAGATGTTGTSVQFATGNIVAQMYSLLQRTKSHVVASPMVTTTNNVTATFNEGETIPYESSTNVVSGSGVVTSNTGTAGTINASSTLSITPRINANGTITASFTPSIDTVGAAPFAGGPPTVGNESVSCVRTIQNGQTMVLGGFVEKNDTDQTSRIPILSDLPLIGNLFRTHQINTDDTELLIFVTVTIIPDDISGINTGDDSGGPVTVAQ